MPTWQALTHDLLRLHNRDALTADGPIPNWVELALQRDCLVVVRRGFVRVGLVPIGVRGSGRHERFAAFAANSEIIERLSPEDLAGAPLPEKSRLLAIPALAALPRVAAILEKTGRSWGPVGSVGFELASRQPTATASSDLDLVLRQDSCLSSHDASELHAKFAAAAEPARVDVLLETPAGGVILADVAANPDRVLIRTPHGARLVTDPWMVDSEVGMQCIDNRVSISRSGPAC
jgi:phosphoribosyl-dephospho-CoA transferase